MLYEKRKVSVMDGELVQRLRTKRHSGRLSGLHVVKSNSEIDMHVE